MNLVVREPYLSTIRTRTPSFSAMACIETLRYREANIPGMNRTVG
jgi:hypothetical protein